MFIKELAFIINSSCCFSEGGKGGILGGGGGGDIGRFILHDNEFGISRFTRKKQFIRSVFLTLVKNYSQRTALFDVLTILPLLVLGAVKTKPSSLFRS